MIEAQDLDLNNLTT